MVWRFPGKERSKWKASKEERGVKDIEWSAKDREDTKISAWCGVLE